MSSRTTIPYENHRFPPEIIAHAVWLYHRFSLSFREVEELLAERGVTLSYGAVRLWSLKFGSAFARKLRHRMKPAHYRLFRDKAFATGRNVTMGLEVV